MLSCLATSPETRWMSINVLLPPAPNPISALLFIRASATRQTDRARTSKQHPGQLGMCGYYIYNSNKKLKFVFFSAKPFEVKLMNAKQYPWHSRRRLLLKKTTPSVNFTPSGTFFYSSQHQMLSQTWNQRA